jgi:hypothetical protein
LFLSQITDWESQFVSGEPPPMIERGDGGVMSGDLPPVVASLLAALEARPGYVAHRLHVAGLLLEHGQILQVLETRT